MFKKSLFFELLLQEKSKRTKIFYTVLNCSAGTNTDNVIFLTFPTMLPKNQTCKITPLNCVSDAKNIKGKMIILARMFQEGNNDSEI